MGRDPTNADTWVMEVLTGASYPRGAQESWGIATAPRPADWPTLRETLDGLRWHCWRLSRPFLRAGEASLLNW